MSILDASQICVRRGGRAILDNVSLHAESGDFIAVIGANGAGKSTLLSMLTRGTACDVVVLALVGERGREVRDFIENDLGPEGMARLVVVVATSDAPPLMRRQCAYTAMTVAEQWITDRRRSWEARLDRLGDILNEVATTEEEP